MARLSRPAYRQAADRLRAAITSGEYSPGSKLPPDTELTEALGTNRSSVGQAVRLLEAEGLVYKHKKATYVSKITTKIPSNRTGRLGRVNRESGEARGAFQAELRSLGFEPSWVTTVDRVAPPARVAELLDVDADQVSTVSRARRMLADEVPVQLATSYLSLDIAEGTALESVDTGPGGSISRLAELGHAQAEITETLDMRAPTPDEAEALGMTEDQRVFEVERVGRTAEGRAVEVTIHVMPAHLWRPSYTWPLDAPAS